jgi:hypothetical protein|tara:strand:- start:1332 stop:1493 length:162 start_codon:yes stop_codon:yes gene_type:complete
LLLASLIFCSQALFCSARFPLVKSSIVTATFFLGSGAFGICFLVVNGIDFLSG